MIKLLLCARSNTIRCCENPEWDMEINSDSDDAAGRARRQAKAEGLTLQGSSSSMTGYKGVSPNINANVGYRAFGRRAAKTKYLGTFNIAEEAALAVARFHAQFDAASSATPSPATKSPVRWASHTSEQRPCARHGAPKTHGAWRREAEREARVWRVAGIPYGLR